MTRLAIRARLLAALTILLSLAVAPAAGAQTIGGVPAPVLFSKSDPYPSASVMLDFVGARTGGQPYFKTPAAQTSVFSSLPGLAVQRASVGYGDCNGQLTLFQPNQPRVTCRGLLEEEGRTNLFLQSQDPATSWTTSAATIGSATTAPDGTATMKSVVPTAVAGQHSLSQSVTVTAATYAVSAYVKASGYSKVGFAEVTSSGAYATFSLAGAGSVIASSGATGSISCSAATAICRISIIYTGAAINQSLRFYVLDNAYTTGTPASYSFTGDGTSGVGFWCMMAELGPAPSSCIPTTTASATRPDETVNLNIPAQPQGTLAVQFLGTPTGLPGHNLVVLDNGLAANVIMTRDNNNSSDTIISVGGVQQYRQVTNSPIPVNSPFTQVVAWSSAGAAYRGSDGVTDSTGAITVPPINRMSLSGGVTGGAQIDNYISRVAIYPYAANAAELAIRAAGSW